MREKVSEREGEIVVEREVMEKAFPRRESEER